MLVRQANFLPNVVGFNLIGGLRRDETVEEVHTNFNPLGRLSAIWIESCPAPGKRGSIVRNERERDDSP